MTPIELLSTEEQAPGLTAVPARLLTEKEAAERLNVSRRTLENWRAKAKEPRFVKLGKLDLMSFLQQQSSDL